MKRAVIILFLGLSLIAFTFLSCNQDSKHQHTFSNDWTYDSVGHWHQSTCSGHPPIKKDYSTHSFDESYECSICGYKEKVFSISKSGEISIYNRQAVHSTLVIPSTLEGITVKRVADRGFYGVGAETIILPDSLVSIGKNAFGNCRWLKSISIPSSVESIAFGAFNTCDSLTSFDVDSENRFFGLVDGCLTSKDGSILYAVPAGKEGTLSISSSIVSQNALLGCTKIQKLMIGASTNSISAKDIDDCTSLEEIEVDGNNKWYYSDGGALYSSNYELISVPCKTTGLFEVPDTTVSIGPYAFSGCQELTDIVIPVSVGIIGESAFSNCNKVEEITITNRNIKYGADTSENHEGAFTGYRGRVILPENIEYIPDYAFYWSRASVEIPDTVTEIKTAAFECWTGSTEIVLPDGLKTIGFSAFYGGWLTRVVLPSTVERIRRWAFGMCTGLNEIEFTGTIEQWRKVSVDDDAFDFSPTTLVRCIDGVTPIY